MRAATPDAYRLMHDGCIALSRVEAAGIRIDVEYLRRAIGQTRQRIAEIEETLKADEIYDLWRREYGQRTNLGSRTQLAHVLYNRLGYKVGAATASGRAQADQRALESINLDFVKLYLECEKLKKAEGTYLTHIEREVEGEFLHPVFNLHTTLTYRSSSDSPNFQNIPVRDPVQGALIRRAFVPRPGRVLVEIDYAAIEVRVAACYHKDTTMLRYIAEGYDMHRDMAAECYMLDVARYTGERAAKALKAARQQAKALFVFAQFYGDYYVSCAKSLWEAIERHKLRGFDGRPLYTHLREQGIAKLGACDPSKPPAPGTFEHHIKQVEDRFWNVRFPQYAKWKRDWYGAYCRRGWFDTLTGFHIAGVMSRNDVINYPVQGSAFHCLLWSLIKLQQWLRKSKMKTIIVGQIHDSILADVVPWELDDFLAKARDTMTLDLRAAWPWIITPLEIEAEGSDVNWHEKKNLKIAS